MQKKRIYYVILKRIHLQAQILGKTHTYTQSVLQGFTFWGFADILVSQVPEWSCPPLGLCYSAIHQLRPCTRALLPQWGALSSQEWEIKAVSTALCWWISTPSTQTPAMAIFKDQGLCMTHEFLPVSAHSAWAGYCYSQLCSGSPRLPTGSCQGQHSPNPWALALDGVQGTGSWGLDTAKTGRDTIRIEDFPLLL